MTRRTPPPLTTSTPTSPLLTPCGACRSAPYTTSPSLLAQSVPADVQDRLAAVSSPPCIPCQTTARSLVLCPVGVAVHHV